MNKSTQRAVSKAELCAKTEPAYAAATIAPLHRAANKKDQAELETVIDRLNLREYLIVVNGCYVAKQ